MTTPLRQKMIEDMQLRGLAVRTQESYLLSVRQLARHYQKISPYHLQPYQKILYSAQSVGKPCCVCISSLPSTGSGRRPLDAALRETAPFSSLETNIPPRQ